MIQDTVKNENHYQVNESITMTHFYLAQNIKSTGVGVCQITVLYPTQSILFICPYRV